MNFAEAGPIVIQVVALGALGLVLGGALGAFGRVFAVKEDPNVAVIREVLPGINCGACGHPGCDGFAIAVADATAKTTDCPVGGQDLADKLAEIMGVDVTPAARLTAYVHCCGDTAHAKTNYAYDGIGDCNATSLMPGNGPKACTFSCIGHGSCVAACPFDAISIVNSIAVINSEKCVACALCIPICPKALIEIVPDEAKIRVECHSTDHGSLIRKNCSAGCIGCKLCEKACPHDAINVIDNLARVDYDKCTLCKICMEKCPTKVIKNVTA
ncbi:MAG: RnfABCDGE type electron transport complex subunit B [Defluviitaleaceae bacterium]|nr:RnfABCDGE type electron transport complex subunit B [Defluviitaleaceae bacterium]